MAKRKFLFGDQGISDQLNAPEGMSLDFLHGGMPQQALKQAMSAQTNTDQIQPKADPQNLDSAGATKPSLFKPTTKQKWLGYDEPTSADEYGLEKPAKHHEGYLSKIAGIGLPALIGLAGGVGLAPGLLTGFLGERGRESALNKQESQAYNKSRADAYQADKLQKELDLKTAAQEETAAHNRMMEYIGLTNANKPSAANQVSPENIFIRSAIPKLVNKQNILNTLQSTLDEYNAALKSGNEEAAYAIGQRALKTINSPEGADAIGREESERLGSQLKMFRAPFGMPGDIGIGRKLPEFGQSLQDTIDVIKGSTSQSINQINDPSSVFGKKNLNKQSKGVSDMSDEEIMKGLGL